MVNRSISKQTLLRLPLYLNYIKQLGDNRPEHISATTIAEALRLNHVVVRKDLASVSSAGKPKIGYVTADLVKQLENFLGYNDVDDAIIVGAGKLGRALLAYNGFQACGMNIVAAFDIDETLYEEDYFGKRVLPMDKLMDLCERMKVRIGIIAVPAENAQAICNLLVESGILAIWNFAPVHLDVPDDILVHNENLAASLALLSKQLKEKRSAQ
ncbi:redox-sensing transcriptional repressor Rex [Anaeromassilibacillus senegalensis]|uniref:Redox-sensing transcriptional repressor Rex n=1 Tax=Anaeromassilibacillus senegalensis TaxID=1673717 RepID=A0ABS9CKT2_9FIRM|nr:redox-sensing transcriptional repressor Rex [Anaeromassilibacillus senegalensis]MCF2651757.1 redox-sensing transcriptional repressor Rex [Anaeromassilibacillus senegalensis]